MNRRRKGTVIRTRIVLIGSGIGFLGCAMSRMPDETPGHRYWPWLLVIGVLMVLGVLVEVWNRRIGSAGVIRWWAWRSRRNDGVASRWIILRRASRWAMKHKAAVLRPSLRGLRVWRRWFVSTKQYATPLARVGWLKVWSAVEDVTIRIGGPRVGKTGEIAGRILDAPGAVIATSTRTDLVELTAGCRSAKGPVQIFNPSGLGGLASSIRFDPLSGCTTPRTAVTRAEDLLSGVSAPGRGGDMQFWEAQAKRALASLLHAAALGEGSMRDVLAWVADPESARDEVQRCLRRSMEPAFEQDAMQFLGTNDRTRSSICATIMPALGWLTDTTAAHAATGGTFDVAELLEQRATVYMLGREDAQVAPLVAALTGHIAREARRLAADQLGGRLDPPLTLALDEAALICPVPLDSWSADMGGRGVTIHIAAQSRSQLKQRWGDDGAATILNNAATLMIFGATRDTDDLNAYSSLTGERYEQVPTWDEDGDMHTSSSRRVPVLTPAQIAGLPPGRVLIIRRNMPVCVGRVQMAWKRRDVKAFNRRERSAARRERFDELTHRVSERATEAAAVAKPKARAAVQRIRNYRTGRDRAPRWMRDIHGNRVDRRDRTTSHDEGSGDR